MTDSFFDDPYTSADGFDAHISDPDLDPWTGRLRAPETQDERIATYHAMRKGGGFLRALAEAYILADNVNAHKILSTWKDEIANAHRREQRD